MALESLGERQQQLLRHLLNCREGVTVDELSTALQISRNAVNQHLASLETAGFIASTTQLQARGRPPRRYTLSASGRELFPRQYALFSKMLLQLVKKRVGSAKLERAMRDLGRDLAESYVGRVQSWPDRASRLDELTKIMNELGYETSTVSSESGPSSKMPPASEIIASNCVFHQLADKNKEVCQLDLAFISNLLGEEIEHRECMLRGGCCCRFGIAKSSE